jgi:hypothetical protein
MPTVRRSAGARRGPVGVSNTLREALSHLESLADTRPDDDPVKVERIKQSWLGGLTNAGATRSLDLPLHACSVAPEHREAVRGFLESWVIPRVRDALDALDGKRIPYNSTVVEPWQ